MINFARSGKQTFGSGEHPRCKKWKRVMDCILKCPKHTKAVSVSAFFKSKGAATKVIACNCTYHDATVPAKEAPPVPVKEVKAAQTSPKTPPKKIVPGASLSPPVQQKRIYSTGHELPKPPDMMKVGDMRDNSGWNRQKNRLPLYFFGPTNGRCPHCGKGNVRAHGAMSHLKLVWDYGLPYYAAGVDIQCSDPSCGRCIKSIDQRYVKTLPRKDRLEIPFLQVGKAYGIDFGVKSSPKEMSNCIRMH